MVGVKDGVGIGAVEGTIVSTGEICCNVGNFVSTESVEFCAKIGIEEGLVVNGCRDGIEDRKFVESACTAVV